MKLSIGQVLRGRTASYHITKVLKGPSVFQAKVVPFEHIQPSQPVVHLAVIKHCSPDLNQSCYSREAQTYLVDSIAQSPFIRSMIELIGHDEDQQHQQPKCMVFEWMDTDLWQLPSKPFRLDSELPRIVARSVLEALAVLDYEDGIHTDVNPNNVFVSGITGSSPVVKLGDLGNAIGIRTTETRCQGLEIRAPEAWMGITITPKADIWSVGVTLAHWLAGNTIFGASDKMVQGVIEQTAEGETHKKADSLTNPWCIAKLIRLVGPMGNPDPSKIDIANEFALAEFLEKETFVHPESGLEERFIKVGTIRQELQKVEGPIDPACIAFIESLLVVDPAKRPSASEALQHSWLKGSTADCDSDWSVD